MCPQKFMCENVIPIKRVEVIQLCCLEVLLLENDYG